jgi:hypothetical protein
MKRDEWTLAALASAVGLFGFLVMLWVGREADQLAVAKAEIGRLKAQLAQQKVTYRVDTVEVVKWQTKWREQRVEVAAYLTDTIPVPVEIVRNVVATCDSLERACTQLKASSGEVIATQDSLIQRQARVIRGCRILGLPCPKIRPGVTVGVDVDGQLNAVAGFGLTF